MDAIQSSIDLLTQQVSQIKWILLCLLVVFSIILVAVLFLTYRGFKAIRKQMSEEDFRKELSDLFGREDFDQVLKMSEERLKTHPKDCYAYWYLGKVYYLKKEWHKALKEFNALYEIAPSWRDEYLDPYINEIKEKLKEYKPEIVKE
ncbi:MAG: hypothetical protein ACYDIC_03675 [Desulfobaccales bacterium]